MSSESVLKIVTVGNSPSVKGGITSVISQIMKHNWSEIGIEMDFIPTYYGGSVVKKIGDFIKGYTKLRKYIKTKKPDVVHIHMSHAGSFTRKYYIHKLCKRHSVADIIHLHSSGFVSFYEQSSEKKKKQIQELLTECSCVIALGDEWEQRVKRISPEANIRVMNNAIAIPKETSNQNVDKLSLLYLGVLVKRKGVMDLLKVIKLLRDDGICKNNPVILTIGGTGECEDELKHYVIENELQDLIKFVGWITGEQKSELLKNSQVMVLPSYNEGLPIAILEAISYGMPIVSTRVGSVEEAVYDGENGFLYNAGDVCELYLALKRIIQEPEMRVRMARSSRKLAEEVFDESKYFKSLEMLYRTYRKAES